MPRKNSPAQRRDETDLTDGQWWQIAPLLPAAQAGGRPRKVMGCERVNHLFAPRFRSSAQAACDQAAWRAPIQRSGLKGTGSAHGASPDIICASNWPLTGPRVKP